MRHLRWALLGCCMALIVGVPAAWAVGWTNVGSADVHFNDNGTNGVETDAPVYSSSIRLYVSTHPDNCGGNNFGMIYEYPTTHDPYAVSDLYEICTAAETPTEWDVSGGNKYAGCFQNNDEPTDPAETCQRYSTT